MWVTEKGTVVGKEQGNPRRPPCIGTVPIQSHFPTGRTGDEEGNVELGDGLVGEGLGGLPADDQLRQPLRDCRLAHPGLPDQAARATAPGGSAFAMARRDVPPKKRNPDVLVKLLKICVHKNNDLVCDISQCGTHCKTIHRTTTDTTGKQTPRCQNIVQWWSGNKGVPWESPWGPGPNRRGQRLGHGLFLVLRPGEVRGAASIK